MHHAQFHTSLFAPGDQLQQAAGVSGGHDSGLGGNDVGHLAVQQLIRHFRLREIVDARTAAAPIGLGQFHQLDSGNRLEELTRLRGDLLSVAEMAGLMVGDHGGIGALRDRLGCGNADLPEPFVDVLHLPVPYLGQRQVGGIVREQVRIMLQVRAAAAGVGNDGVVLPRRELVDVPARQPLGQLPFAVVGVQRSAAALVGGRDDLARVAGQHLDGVAIHTGEGQILGAAREHRDTVTTRSSRSGHWFDEIRGKRLFHHGGHRLQLLKAFRHQAHHAAGAQCRLQPGGLPQAHAQPQQLEALQIIKKPAKGEGADQRALGRCENLRALRLGAGRLEEFGVVHAGGTRGHAGETPEAEVHLLGEGLAGLETVIRNGAHQGDASAGRIALQLGGVVGRAGRQAQAAVHALLHDRVVEALEERHRLSRPGRSRRGTGGKRTVTVRMGRGRVHPLQALAEVIKLATAGPLKANSHPDTFPAFPARDDAAPLGGHR